MVQCYNFTQIHLIHKEENFILSGIQACKNICWQSWTASLRHRVSACPESHTKNEMAIKDVLQTIYSVFSNNHNKADETPHVYGLSFPLSFSQFLWLCHQVSLEKRKKGQTTYRSICARQQTNICNALLCFFFPMLGVILFFDAFHCEVNG